jgi:importin subunit alpha-6/7
LVSLVLNQLQPSAEWDVRKEAAWVVSNIATSGRADQITHLIQLGGMRPLCDLLEVGDTRILGVALDALDAILKSAPVGNTAYISLVDESEGVEKLEQLQEHADPTIYQKAVQMIETHFGGEDEDAGAENLAPTMNANATFSFGMDSTAKPAAGVFSFGAAAAGAAPKGIDAAGSNAFAFNGSSQFTF